eukprot:gene1663-biopygen1423
MAAAPRCHGGHLRGQRCEQLRDELHQIRLKRLLQTTGTAGVRGCVRRRGACLGAAAGRSDSEQGGCGVQPQCAAEGRVKQMRVVGLLPPREPL